MNGTDVYVSGSLTGLLLDFLDDLSLDAPRLRQDLHESQAHERIPIKRWWSFLDSIHKIYHRPALGLHIGFKIRPHHVGVLGYLAISCSTVVQALMSFQRYQMLLHNQAPMFVSQQSEGLCCYWDPEYSPSTQLSDEIMVASILTLTRIMTGLPDIQFSSVRFTHPRSSRYGKICEKLLNCPVKFDQPSMAIVIPTQLLELPINTADTYLLRLMEQQAESHAKMLPQLDELLPLLKKEIIHALQEGETSFEAVCKRMDMSSRSISRRLKVRGLTFNSILLQIRLNLALGYLEDSTLLLSEIAQLLGYSEQSAFTRAFKRWYKVTPLSYRKNLMTVTKSTQDLS
ncbi:hypothetical protein JH25_27980 [Pseudomonas sp. BRG-100]|uniref:AraC family transcriptional regulator n=1 Tax=Pseudomonas sp. BRG-100 TaxID=1524267 RepID=UPI0004E6E290|nr:AraC family transcriptional regulator [Pseudomonas sp. BRG-100]KFF42205.1 hypothetical protein JH25_27980 [Pseudomonas sp. BRG-100]